jgi:hypothetical protein
MESVIVRGGGIQGCGMLFDGQHMTPELLELLLKRIVGIALAQKEDRRRNAKCLRNAPDELERRLVVALLDR